MTRLRVRLALLINRRVVLLVSLKIQRRPPGMRKVSRRVLETILQPPLLLISATFQLSSPQLRASHPLDKPRGLESVSFASCLPALWQPPYIYVSGDLRAPLWLWTRLTYSLMLRLSSPNLEGPRTLPAPLFAWECPWRLEGWLLVQLLLSSRGQLHRATQRSLLRRRRPLQRTLRALPWSRLAPLHLKKLVLVLTPPQLVQRLLGAACREELEHFFSSFHLLAAAVFAPPRIAVGKGHAALPIHRWPLGWCVKTIKVSNRMQRTDKYHPRCLGFWQYLPRAWTCH